MSRPRKPGGPATTIRTDRGSGSRSGSELRDASVPARRANVIGRAAAHRAAVRAKPTPPAPALRTKLRKIKLFLCDVDGVLTNGTVLIGDGKEFKSFNIQDGLGLLLLKRNGIKVGWVSNRPSQVTQQRAEE